MYDIMVEKEKCRDKGVLYLLNIEDIKALIKVIDTSSINEFKYETEDTKITLKKQAAAAPVYAIAEAPAVQQAVSAPAAPAARADEAKESGDPTDDPSLHKIVAPMVGTFYSASSPDAEPFVTKGTKVNKDTVVCIVEAMKLFNEIEADVKGEIVDVLVENGQLVEYGQPLFLVKEG